MSESVFTWQLLQHRVMSIAVMAPGFFRSLPKFYSTSLFKKISIKPSGILLSLVENFFLVYLVHCIVFERELSIHMQTQIVEGAQLYDNLIHRHSDVLTYPCITMPRWQNHGQWSCQYRLCSPAFPHFMPCVEASKVRQKCSLIFVAPTWQVWLWAVESFSSKEFFIKKNLYIIRYI